MTILSLPELFSQILDATKKLSGLPVMEDETQELVAESLKNLKDLHSRIIDLSLFSPNETLEDISTRDLVYLVVPYVFAEAQGRERTTRRTERMNCLIQTERYIQSFISLLEQYDIVPEDEQALFDRKTVDVADYAKRRELKVKQYKKEKDIKARIETFQKRRGHAPLPDDNPTDFDLIASLLPIDWVSKSKDANEERDCETDDIVRETTLLLLRLLYAHASTQLQSMEQELELLRNAPPSPMLGLDDDDDDDRAQKRKPEENDWKLDIPLAGGPDGKGPLLDSSGKPLRTFTILPSSAADRARLQAQVFGPGHRLPTMTIDEYLEIERERGNILTGGGAASQNAPTSSEQLAIESEMDGTLEGENKEEVKRQKDENWARYTDDNPRGMGNTMNRG